MSTKAEEKTALTGNVTKAFLGFDKATSEDTFELSKVCFLALQPQQSSKEATSFVSEVSHS